MTHYDALIVGAGFSGLVIAERLITQLGKRCLVVEKRPHLGGNAYDFVDRAGVLIHAYGPHYFRTNSPKVRDYLSQFTDWHHVEYKILSFTEGKYWSFPINLNTFEQLLGRPSSSEEMIRWLEKNKVKIENPQNSEEIIISQVGYVFYKKFFEGYTIKQWKRHPRELDPCVCGRIPIRTNRDDRYLSEDFQALPKHGYTKMFERLVAVCRHGLDLRLNTDYRDILSHVTFDYFVYTGPLDEFFGERLGRLPYRSLRFEPQSFGPEELESRLAIAGKRGFWQPAMQVNYPNDEEFTRIVEIKHATGQQTENTTIVREYPQDYGAGAEPYYPIPTSEATALARRYSELAKNPQAVCARLRELGAKLPSHTVLSSFIGRLATYRYYNMDQVTGMALAEFGRISPRLSCFRAK